MHAHTWLLLLPDSEYLEDFTGTWTSYTALLWVIYHNHLWNARWLCLATCACKLFFDNSMILFTCLYMFELTCIIQLQLKLLHVYLLKYKGDMGYVIIIHLIICQFAGAMNMKWRTSSNFNVGNINTASNHSWLLHHCLFKLHSQATLVHELPEKKQPVKWDIVLVNMIKAMHEYCLWSIEISIQG